MPSATAIRIALSAFCCALALFMIPQLGATTLGRDELTCALCGTKSSQVTVNSSNSMGAPDLDLRPAEMQRSTMPYWVQECPKCGYCNSSLAEVGLNARKATSADAYRAQLKNPAFPALANRFLCMMRIQDAGDAPKKAIRAALCAAWTCDDAKKGDQAKQARLEALVRLNTLKEMGSSLYPQKGADETVQADLERRVGHYQVAAEVARKGLTLKPDDFFTEALKLEIKLSEEKDSRCHSFSEIPEPSEKKPKKKSSKTGAH
jgi:hypothetical protein